MKYKYSDDSIALYYSLWYDCLERLDLLLLESRHLQQNIIYNLREPILYRILRHEEDYLWENNYVDFCLHNEPADYKKLAEFCVLRFPYKFQNICVPTISKKVLKNNYSPFVNMYNSMSRRIDELHLTNLWSFDERQQYRALQSIQTIKRSIYYDKLYFGRFGAMALYVQNDEGQLDPLSSTKLLVLRRGILAKTSRYIERLGEYHDQFSKSQDSGIFESPRPSVSRRREQSLYNTYLANRCMQCFKEIQQILRLYGIKNVDLYEQINISHGWTHNYSSKVTRLYDDMSFDNTAADRLNAPQVSFFVSSSYWMPERPDLQNIISHEIAHCALYKYFDNLSESYVASTDNGLTSLFREIIYVLNLTSITDTYGLVNEIACDILAATASGPSYLYALFTELIGDGLDVFLKSSGKITLELIDHLNGIGGSFDISRTWFIRIHIVCSWLEQIAPERRTDNLVSRLIDSIRCIIDNLNTGLDDISPPNSQLSSAWIHVKNELHQVILSLPGTTSIGKTFYTKFKKDYYYYNEAEGGYTWGPRELDKSYYALPIKLRNYLLKFLINKKLRLLDDDRKNLLIKHFQSNYKVRIPDNILNVDYSEITCPVIFKFLQDIPWQCSYLRALDSMHQNSCFKLGSSDQFVLDAQKSRSFARELFHIALDFYLAGTESSSARVSEISRLIASYDIDTKLNFNFDDSLAFLYDWLFGANFPDLILRQSSKILVKHFGYTWMLLPHTSNYINGLNDFIDNVKSKSNSSLPLYDTIILKNVSIFLDNLRFSGSPIEIYDFFINYLSTLLLDEHYRIGMAGFCRTTHDLGSNYKQLIRRLFLFSNELNSHQIQIEADSLLDFYSSDSRFTSKSNKISNILNQHHSASDILYTYYKTEDPFILKRILERSLGHKIRTLCDRLISILPAVEDQSMLRLIGNIISYSAIRSSRVDFLSDQSTPLDDNRDFYSKIINAFDKDTETPSTTSEYSQLILLGRMSTASDSIGIDRKLYNAPSPAFNVNHDVHRILGRYDYFIINNNPAPLGREMLFQFPTTIANKYKELYSSFFTRWEYAKKLYFKHPNKSVHNYGTNNKILAYISVTLNSNTSRLNFAYRLLHSHELLRKHELLLESIINQLHSSDYILLSDGWGDLLFVLHDIDYDTCKSHERIINIFKIQNTLYQDFQVDRTELFFTPAALMCLFYSYNNFIVSFHIRMKEDRTSGTINDSFCDSISKKLNTSSFPLADNINFSITKTPGFMDFIVRLESISIPDDNMKAFSESFYDNLLSCFSGLQLDRITTNLQHKFISCATNQPALTLEYFI